jgi:ankyrin repeat protein
MITDMCTNGDILCLRRHLKRGGIAVGARSLCNAAAYSRMEITRFLVTEDGMDVNTTYKGFFSFYIAAQYGHLVLVRFVGEELGANVEQADEKGVTLLYVAAQSDQLAVMKCLVKELGADVNRRSLDGFTVLMAATARKQVQVVTWLLKNGANAQATFKDTVHAQQFRFPNLLAPQPN